MTTTPPIIDIRGVVYWGEVVNEVTKQAELRPLRTEIRFQREGFDEWELLRYENVVPPHLIKQPGLPDQAPVEGKE